MGQAPARTYMQELYQQIVDEKFDPTTIITHKLPLDQAHMAYDKFNDRKDNCIKVVLKP